MAAKNKKPDKEDSLSGRCFHVFGENGVVDRQGIVLARVDAEHYLVQYHEWSTGYASAQQVVAISEMTSSPKQARGPWQWQFYKDDVHMIEWLERNGPKLVSNHSDAPDRETTTRRQWQWPRRTDASAIDRDRRKRKMKTG